MGGPDLWLRRCSGMDGTAWEAHETTLTERPCE